MTLFEAGKTLQVILERELVGEKLLTPRLLSLDTGDPHRKPPAPTARATRAPPRSSPPDGVWPLRACTPSPSIPSPDLEARLRRRFDRSDRESRSDAQPCAYARRLSRHCARVWMPRASSRSRPPILQYGARRASARPFRTYINAYGEDLTLRTPPELYPSLPSGGR